MSIPTANLDPMRSSRLVSRRSRTLSATARASDLQPREVGRSLTPSSRGWAGKLGLISQKTRLAEASAVPCQREWLVLFVGGGGIELLEAPLS